LDKLEEEDINGLLMLVDFEKAFDTVEFYGFGPTLTKWIKSVHTDIVSAVINNGHLPELFLHMLDLLSAALKNDPLMSDVTINGSEYLLSQYADDSTLILGDDTNSLEQALNIYDCFSVCAGLRVNLDKMRPYGLAQD
jgi:hypothetical protein